MSFHPYTYQMCFTPLNVPHASIHPTWLFHAALYAAPLLSLKKKKIINGEAMRPIIIRAPQNQPGSNEASPP